MPDAGSSKIASLLGQAFRDISVAQQSGKATAPFLSCGFWSVPEVNFFRGELIEVQTSCVRPEHPNDVTSREVALVSSVPIDVRRMPFALSAWKSAQTEKQKMDLVEIVLGECPILLSISKGLQKWADKSSLLIDIVPLKDWAFCPENAGVAPDRIDIHYAIAATRLGTLLDHTEFLVKLFNKMKMTYKFVYPYPPSLMSWVKVLTDLEFQIIRDVNV